MKKRGRWAKEDKGQWFWEEIQGCSGPPGLVRVINGQSVLHSPSVGPTRPPLLMPPEWLSSHYIRQDIRWAACVHRPARVKYHMDAS